MEDGYEKVGKVLREGIHGEKIDFIQKHEEEEKLLIKLKTGRVITIEIDSIDEDAVLNAY